MRGSTQGESNVYADIIQRIANLGTAEESGKGLRSGPLSKRIASIQDRNKDFFDFGLTPRFNGAEFMQPIQGASRPQLAIIGPILQLYLDNFEAKLNALQDIQDRIRILLGALNSFFLDKRIDFNVRTGFTIRSRNNESLSPTMLSSGERHLLLLFCNTVTALDKRSIFIIDEPEISLNVKWQRTLISSLISCARNSPIQYILATHSMELLSHDLDKVVKLESRGEPKVSSGKQAQP